MRKLLGCMVIIFAGATPFLFSKDPAPVNKPDEKLHTQCLYPTIKIANEKETAGGTGFVVRSTKVGEKWHNIYMTVAHTVLHGEQDYKIHVPKYKEWSQIESYDKYDTHVYAINKAADIALGVFVSPEKIPVVELGFDTKLFIDTKIFHIGYGLLDDARIDHGTITQPINRIPKAFSGTIRTNAHTFLGDSGGPLFDGQSYKVIGICHGIRMHSKASSIYLPNISYFVPIDHFKKWDSEVNNTLESVYKESAPMPVVPFVKLALQEYDYLLP